MEYPIVISGIKAGELSVNADGLYTVFEAWIPERHDSTLIRLWLCGDEKRVLLGVMRPDKGGLYLRKKLSRNAMRDFPKTILFACQEGDAYTSDADKKKTTDECPSAESNETTASEQKPATLREQKPATENEAEKQLLWFSSASGVLSAFDGCNSLTAIPASLRRASTGADVRVIDGKEYIVFRKH